VYRCIIKSLFNTTKEVVYAAYRMQICACMCMFKYVRVLGMKLRPTVLFPQLGWARQGG